LVITNLVGKSPRAARQLGELLHVRDPKGVAVTCGAWSVLPVSCGDAEPGVTGVIRCACWFVARMWPSMATVTSLEGASGAQFSSG